MYTREDLSDGYQMSPRLSPTLSYTNGLNCLKLTDSLYVKQHASLKEGKLFEKKIFFMRIYVAYYSYIWCCI